MGTHCWRKHTELPVPGLRDLVIAALQHNAVPEDRWPEEEENIFQFCWRTDKGIEIEPEPSPGNKNDTTEPSVTDTGDTVETDEENSEYPDGGKSNNQTIKNEDEEEGFVCKEEDVSNSECNEIGNSIEENNDKNVELEENTESKKIEQNSPVKDELSNTKIEEEEVIEEKPKEIRMRCDLNSRKQLYAVNTDDHKLLAMINLVRSWDLCWLEEHPLCRMERKCHYCLLRSLCLRLKTYGRGPLSLRPDEIAISLNDLNAEFGFDMETVTVEVILEKLIQKMCWDEKRMNKILNQDCSECPNIGGLINIDTDDVAEDSVITMEQIISIALQKICQHEEEAKKVLNVSFSKGISVFINPNQTTVNGGDFFYNSHITEQGLKSFFTAKETLLDRGDTKIVQDILLEQSDKKLIVNSFGVHENVKILSLSLDNQREINNKLEITMNIYSQNEINRNVKRMNYKYRKYREEYNAVRRKNYENEKENYNALRRKRYENQKEKYNAIRRKRCEQNNAIRRKNYDKDKRKKQYEKSKRRNEEFVC